MAYSNELYTQVTDSHHDPVQGSLIESARAESRGNLQVKPPSRCLLNLVRGTRPDVIQGI
jgi:hypothetical protein